MAVNLSPVGGVAAQFFTNSGVILSGGKLDTYLAGTTTRAVTYTSAGGTTAWTNPINLNSAGRVPGSGEIWLTDGIQYKFVLSDVNDVLIATYDNISGINSNFVNFTNAQEIQTATASQTVFTLTTMQYQPGTNSLSVFVDGVNQYGPGAQYAFVETDATTVTFVTGLHVGASVKFTTSAINAASYGDAFQISYTPPYVDSVATNVGDKLAQTVSVMDFGAVGDGSTDDTNAIQAAVDAAKEVFFPPGVYVVSSPIDLPNGTWLTGVGGFQNTATDRISKINYTGTSGWAFQFESPANLANFYGDFAVKGLMINSPNIVTANSGGCLLFGNTDTANFNTYGYIGRVNIDQCWFTGNDKSIGVYFVKVFDSTIANSYFAGFNYGVWLYGSDINKITQNRFLSNVTHIRATTDGSFGGGLKIEHNDILTCIYTNIWLEGVFGAQLLDNYIEAVAPNAQAVAQTGTVTTSPYTTTVTGSGTTFVTQFATAIGTNDPRRVLVKMGDDYRQVTSITNNTTLVVDQPFLAELSGQSWAIVYGTGVIASSCSTLSSLDNRIDITSTSATVPRFYCAGGTGNISDYAAANPDNGEIVVVKANPGAGVSVLNRYKLENNSPVSKYNASFDFVFGTNDQSQPRNLSDVPRTTFRTTPQILFDYRNWFEQTGLTPKLISASADVNGTPSVSLYNSNPADDVSSYLPSEYFGNRLRIRIRVKPVSVASTITIYAGATLGAKTTTLGSFSAATPGSWTQYDFCTVNPATIASGFNAITITKSTQILYYDYVIIEVLDPNSFIFGTNSPESVYTAPVGAMYRRTNGGANTTLYVKESGTGNTGWVAK